MPTVKHVNDRNGVIVMTVLFIILTITVVTLRFYTRHITRAGYGLDDWLAVAALVSPLTPFSKLLTS